MRHQVSQPRSIVDVGLAPRHVLDVGGVGQHQLEPAVGQNVPDWHYAGLPTHIDLRTFRTQVIGAVDRPLQLSFDDLRTKFEPVTLTAFSQCSGNSRSFFRP
jgi:DMSO/TMAO reductase YedYZ molybdopterin-dependent catalytic subunit